MGEALTLAMNCHRQGNLDDAEGLYGAILQLEPGHADALHFLGILHHQRGDSARGVELIERAIAATPTNPGLFNNFGNVLYELERFDEAALAYEQAIALSAQPGTYNNLGAARRVQGRFEDAERAYQRALELDPKYADAHNNYGNLLASRGRIREALDHFCTAMTLLPSHPEARRQLGIAYASLGRKEEAAAVYQQWLKDEPDNAVAAHMLAACSGKDVPGRASDRFVEGVFDNFARSFDVKLARLDYRAPELVAQAVARVAETNGRLRALDAGCGTGLCGPLLERFVSTLIGVDLSAQMLVKARTRPSYTELVKAELTAYLSAQKERFDLIISADTLVYFGALEAVLAAARGALAANGHLIFSVERASEELAGETGHVLNAHGRFSHAESYLHRALTGAGLTALSLEPGVLRMEAGKPVAGVVVTAQKR